VCAMRIGNHALCGANTDGFLVQVRVANALRNCHGGQCEPLSVQQWLDKIRTCCCGAHGCRYLQD
jgi:hypothetical protein